MVDQQEENKRNVVALYDLMFNQGKPAKAAEKYVGDGYVQHNPGAAELQVVPLRSTSSKTTSQAIYAEVNTWKS